MHVHIIEKWKKQSPSGWFFEACGQPRIRQQLSYHRDQTTFFFVWLSRCHVQNTIMRCSLSYHFLQCLWFWCISSGSHDWYVTMNVFSAFRTKRWYKSLLWLSHSKKFRNFYLVPKNVGYSIWNTTRGLLKAWCKTCLCVFKIDDAITFALQLKIGAFSCKAILLGKTCER